tara:strand:- start:141 stop:371 length:231 start_codon:yes stop_codon:yes gene_type:complete
MFHIDIWESVSVRESIRERRRETILALSRAYIGLISAEQSMVRRVRHSLISAHVLTIDPPYQKPRRPHRSFLVSAT